MKKIIYILLASIVCSTTLFAQTPPSYIPTNGLVGWWPFNGNANDSSGNGNNGVLSGNATYSYDRFLKPNSAYFGDVNSGVNILNQNGFPFGNSERTISLW